ncbi:hypothetical protein Tco_0572998 [Tanacetum coccineum]
MNIALVLMIAQLGMNMGQDRQMQIVRGNGGNQFRQYARQNVGNQNGYNAAQNVRNQNPNGNGNVIAAWAEGNAIRNNEAGIQLQAEEFDLMAAAANLYEIKEVNANCILIANLHQFVRDIKSLAKEADETLLSNKTLELETERLLRAFVSQDIMSIVQNPSVVNSSNLQTELDRTKERLENYPKMAAVNNVPQLVDKKGGSYAAIAPKLKAEKFDNQKRLKVMISLNDIMKSVISCETAKATWIDLVHSFEGPSDTKENKIMDLKLEYQTFRPLKASHRPTPAIRPCLMSLPKMVLTSLNKKSIYLWKDFQENSDDEVDGRSSKEYLKDLDIEFHERALLEKFKAQADPKVQKDYKAEYKKMKAKLTLLEANLSTSQTPKTFQPKNKGLVAETFDWDEEEVSDDEEVTQVKVLMALADDELTIRKNHARNGELLTSL